MNVKILMAAALLSGSAAFLPGTSAMSQTVDVQVGSGGVSLEYGERYGRGRLTVRPSVAEIGQRVTVIGRDLRPGARLTVLGGRNPARLSRLTTVRADATGSVVLRVRIPDWAVAGRNFVFALQTPGGRIVAQSRPVQIVDGGDEADDSITVTGELLDPNATCPRLAGDDGRIYALAGSLRQFETGDRVRVTGELADVSICQQRRTIEIERIRSAE